MPGLEIVIGWARARDSNRARDGPGLEIVIGCARARDSNRWARARDSNRDSNRVPGLEIVIGVPGLIGVYQG